MADQIKTLSRGTAIETGKAVRGSAPTSNAPNLLSSMGAEISQQAVNAFAEHVGYENGKNLQNEDKLPAIFDVQKHYQAAYNAEATNTLDIRANDLLVQSQVDVSQGPLTDESIQSFTDNVSEGLKNLSDLAPNHLKTAFESKYGVMAYNARAKLQDKKYKADLEQKKSQSVVAAKTVQSQIYDTASNGQGQIALMAAASEISHNNEQVKLGLITPEAANTNNLINQKNAWAGIFNNKAQAAIANRDLPNFIASISGPMSSEDRKLGMTEEIWEATQQSTLNYVTLQENMQKRAEGNLIAQTKLRIKSGGYSPSELEKVLTGLSPQKAAEMSIYYHENINKQQSLENRAQHVAANLGNPVIAGQATGSELNKGLELAANAMEQEGVDRFQAETMIQASSVVPIPQYISGLNTLGQSASSSNLEKFNAGMQAIQDEGNVIVLDKVDPKSKTAGRLYQKFLGMHASDEAAFMAHSAVWNKSDEQQAINDENYKIYKSTSITPGGKVNIDWLRQVTEADPTTAMNVNELSAWSQEIFKAEYNLTNGDVETAMKRTQDEIRGSWSTTTINGKKQFAYLPPGQVINAPEGSNSLMQEDMISQLMPQLQETKDAFDQGHVSFYYRIKPRLTNKDAQEAIKQAKQLRSEQWSSPITKGLMDIGKRQVKVYNLKHEVQKYLDQGPATLEKVDRNGKVTESNKLAIKADPLLARTNDSANPIVGGYNVMAQTESGLMDLQRVGMVGQPIKYFPNKEKIMENYDILAYQPQTLAQARLGRFGDENFTYLNKLKSSRLAKAITVDPELLGGAHKFLENEE